MSHLEEIRQLEQALAAQRARHAELEEYLRRQIAERQEAEAVQRQTLKNLERISNEWRDTLDALSDLVILIDHDGRILRINRTAEVWGLGSVRDLPGRDLHDMLHGPCDEADCDLVRTWDRLHGIGGDGAGDGLPGLPALIEREYEDWRLSRRVRLTARRLDGSDDGVAFALLVLRDVTVFHHRRVTLSRREQLETMWRMVRGLAHEIGNPLAAMKTSVQVLVRNFDRFDRDKKESYLGHIVAGADRIQAIIDRVLSEKEWKIEELGPVPLAALLKRTWELFDGEMENRQIHFEVRPVRDADRTALLGDRAAIEAVLAIVLGNAMDACGTNGAGSGSGRVYLAAHVDSRQVRLEVGDNGSGIRDGDLDRVFQPFFTTKPQGMGLGMAHAHHLMAQMEGRIEIESVESRGTTVTLIFPPAHESSAGGGS